MVHETVFVTFIRLDETEPLGLVEPLHRAFYTQRLLLVMCRPTLHEKGTPPMTRSHSQTVRWFPSKRVVALPASYPKPIDRTIRCQSVVATGAFLGQEPFGKIETLLELRYAPPKIVRPRICLASTRGLMASTGQLRPRRSPTSLGRHPI